MQNLKMDNNDGEDALQLVPLGKLCLKLRGVSYSKGEATAFPAEDYLPILRANNIDDNDLNYFGYFFSSASYRNHISDVSAGTSINNLKNEHFENIIFPLPSLKKQRTIAAQIDNLLPDIKINKTRL